MWYAADDAAVVRAATGSPRAALPAMARGVTMGEGATPLVTCAAAGHTVHAKLDSLNPTCSFKDRGSAALVSAVADASTPWQGIVVASTGNTAPSVAAYAARAGVPVAVVVPAGTSMAKLGQVAAHDATVFTVEGTFSDCFTLAQQTAGEAILNATAVYSANPFVAMANRTVAFELLEQLPAPPTHVTVPVGAGPLLGGIDQGFREAVAAGLLDRRPAMVCVQARGCHPIVQAYEADRPVTAWTEPITTTVGAIADPLVGYPEDGETTRQAVLDSGGSAIALPDAQIHAAADDLARRYGIYAEPAAAAGVGVVEELSLDADAVVVAMVTGHGLKEPPASDGADGGLARPADPDAIAAALVSAGDGPRAA